MEIVGVFGNISKNFLLVQSDFIGLKFSMPGFFHGFTNFFLALLLILVYFLLGNKIRLFVKSSNIKNFSYFIDIALGYIFVNSGLAILGIFSLIYPTTLWLYIITILFIAIYPNHRFRNSRNALKAFNAIKSRAENNKWIFFGIFLFVFIAFLRLIPPETGEDAIGYHTSDPHLFLKNNTTMLLPKAPPHVLLAPHLGEMSYMVFEFIGYKDASRYLHFIFYLLVVFFIFFIQPYGALLFVTAPVIIQVSSKANVDFQWILCWLIAIYIVTKVKDRNIKDFMLAGILFGGVLASKLWTIAFFPLFILYLLIVHRKLRLNRKFNIIFIFFLCALLLDVVWLWRSYAISGNPVYPAFSTIIDLQGIGGALSVGSLIGFNSIMFHARNIIVFSPLFFLAIIAFLLNWRYALKTLRRANLSLFFALLATEYLFIQYHFGRYLLGLYSLAILIVPVSVNHVIKKHKLYKIIFAASFGVMFIYYFLNTLLILPYGFGWADSNKYLTRILARDNSSYFDFDKKFNRYLSDKDKVATFETYGYYYANFDYIDINYIFDKNNKSFGSLRKYGITKLFIKGGTVEWFCVRLKIPDCYNNNYKLLAEYTPYSRYLYEITRK